MVYGRLVAHSGLTALLVGLLTCVGLGEVARADACQTVAGAGASAFNAVRVTIDGPVGEANSKR